MKHMHGFFNSGTSRISSAAALACLTICSGSMSGQSWVPVNPMMDSVVGSGAAVGSDRRLYVVGGQYVSGGGFTNNVSRLDPIAGTWSSAPGLQTARRNHATVTGCDGKLYAIGGIKTTLPSGQLSSVETYVPGGASWSYGTDLQPRQQFVATVGTDCRIYAFSRGLYNDTIEMQTFDTNPFNTPTPWTFATLTFAETALYGAATAHNGTIYLLGEQSLHMLNGTVWTSSNTGSHGPITLGVDGKLYFLDFISGPFTFPGTPLNGYWNYGHNEGALAATAEGKVFWLGTDKNDTEAYSSLKASVGPYEVWWQFNNATALGDYPAAHQISNPTACLFSPGLSSINRVAGLVGYAARFDPTIPNGQNIHLVNDPGCADVTTPDFTIEFWMNHNGSATSSVQSILDKRTTESAGPGYHVGLYQGRIVIQMDNGLTYLNVFTPPAAAIPANQWTHVAISVSRLLSVGTMWFNGVLVSRFTPLVGGSYSSPTTQLRIGTHNFSTAAGYQGMLDELTFYHRALTYPEIRSIFLAGSQGKQ
jgi:hypothetical protein